VCAKISLSEQANAVESWNQTIEALTTPMMKGIWLNRTDESRQAQLGLQKLHWKQINKYKNEVKTSSWIVAADISTICTTIASHRKTMQMH
jgi:hypothetical protein